MRLTVESELELFSICRY